MLRKGADSSNVECVVQRVVIKGTARIARLERVEEIVADAQIETQPRHQLEMVADPYAILRLADGGGRHEVGEAELAGLPQKERGKRIVELAEWREPRAAVKHGDARTEGGRAVGAERWVGESIGA